MSVALALGLDLLFGELPAGLHPVVWMGRYLRWAGRRLGGVWDGGLYLGLGAGACAVVGFGLEQLAALLPYPIAILFLAMLLEPLFSLRLLLIEVGGVERALGESLDTGRSRLSRIVSRDTSSLDASQVRAAALESLAENLSDSLVAPLLFYVVFGLPGAALYRFVNTADAMWGYRGSWRWKGRVAARVDDLLNLIPARLTALALWPFSLARLRREAAKAPSPNAGWPMAALGLALGVQLGKRAVYLLNPEGRVPEARDLARGLARARLVGLLSALGLALLAWEVRGA